ncbi:MAG: tyrosine-protein phosphatase, partial [Firmicutes bacterium]|nr:tyrosine-protein phosphatase [Bacillota bacterium]
VRWGKLFRSGRLSRLTEADRQLIQALQIHAICDLRSSVEVGQDPTPAGLAESIKALPLKLSSTAPNKLVSLSGTDAVGAWAQSMMKESYQTFVQSIEAYREFFQLLLENPSTVLFHCTAGKDRTGVTAALILWALDVPWNIIVQDFLLSNQFTDQFIPLINKEVRDFLLSNPFTPPIDAEVHEDEAHALWPFVRVEAANLEAAMQAITDNFGGMDQFFTQTLGLPETWKKTLQDFYLEA